MVLFQLLVFCGVNKPISKSNQNSTFNSIDKPSFADKWSAINDSIKVGWKLHSARPSDKMVPDTFAYAFSEWTLFYWDLYFTQI